MGGARIIRNYFWYYFVQYLEKRWPENETALMEYIIELPDSQVKLTNE